MRMQGIKGDIRERRARWEVKVHALTLIVVLIVPLFCFGKRLTFLLNQHSYQTKQKQRQNKGTVKLQ